VCSAAWLEHIKQVMEDLCKANGTTLHYILTSFVLIDLSKVSVMEGKDASNVNNVLGSPDTRSKAYICHVL